jgi:NitT/TauT family transport system substrate-binding protein
MKKIAPIIAALVMAAGVTHAQELAEVRLGTTLLLSDAPFFIAERNGYFKEQGLAVKLVYFDSGAKVIAPLGAGQLDVGAGASSAGLFNAAARGIDNKIVADKGTLIPGAAYLQIIVRKALVESGTVKGARDLKGLKVAEAGQGGSPGSTLNEALKSVGLRYGDVQHVYNMGYPLHVGALASGAVDATVTAEPSLTQALERGVAMKLPGPDPYPNQQIAVLLYGGDFIKKRPEVARKFMVAYVKAARYYNGALQNGTFGGPNAEAVVNILAQDSNVKDPTLIRKMHTNGCNPNGRVNEKSLGKDLEFFREAGYIQGNITLDQIVDHSFVDAAVKVLGPYRPQRQRAGAK